MAVAPEQIRKIQNINSEQHIINKALYNGLTKLSNLINKRRLYFAGHRYRQHGDPFVSDLVLLQPKQKVKAPH